MDKVILLSIGDTFTARFATKFDMQSGGVKHTKEVELCLTNIEYVDHVPCQARFTTKSTENEEYIPNAPAISKWAKIWQLLSQ